MENRRSSGAEGLVAPESSAREVAKSEFSSEKPMPVASATGAVALVCVLLIQPTRPARGPATMRTGIPGEKSARRCIFGVRSGVNMPIALWKRCILRSGMRA